MIDTIRNKIKKTRQFVEDHTTLVACGASAAAASYLTRKHDIKITTELFYALGLRHALKEEMLNDTVVFIKNNDQWDAFLESVEPWSA